MADLYSLYLVRHAIAEERSDAYPDDTKRPLTPNGMSKFRKAARGLAALDVAIDRILSSPLVRARQTAEILAQQLSGHPAIAETAALTPEATFKQLKVELESCARYSSIALVGHAPSIGDLAAHLLGLPVPLDFKKGAVCRIDLEALPPAAPGHLRWFLTAKMLSKIAK